LRTVTHMRPFIAQALASLGVLIASAILDLGPRAQAAYQLVGITAAHGLGVGDALGQDAEGEEHSSSSAVEPQKPDHNLPACGDCHHAWGQTGGAGSSAGGGSGPSPSSAGVIAPTTPPPSDLVAPFCSLPATFALPVSMGSILDPPRAF
jgi:hypothetical protein